MPIVTPHTISPNAILHTPDWMDDDPRGLLLVYEEPQPSATYILGCDPTKGLTGWDRLFRTKDDHKTDNAAIEVLKVGKSGAPDVQVAEWAAPVDSFEFAGYINAIGRLYGRGAMNNQAKVILEIWPGPGLITQNELINTYRYTNFHAGRYRDGASMSRAGNLNWTSSPKSVRDLWIRGARHINMGRNIQGTQQQTDEARRQIKITLRSPYLVEELSDCVSEDGQTASAEGSEEGVTRHDDRVSALLFAIWAAHDFDTESFNEDSSTANQPEIRIEDLQGSMITSEQMEEILNRHFQKMIREAGNGGGGNGAGSGSVEYQRNY